MKTCRHCGYRIRWSSVGWVHRPSGSGYCANLGTKAEP